MRSAILAGLFATLMVFPASPMLAQAPPPPPPPPPSILRNEWSHFHANPALAQAAPPALAQEAPLKPGIRTISVSGHGEIKTKPDLMIVSFSVDSTAPSADQCTELQTEKSRKLVDTLKAKLAEKAKIETSDYSLGPTYEAENTATAPSPEVPPAVWSYKATITAGSDDIAILGALVDAGLAAGATDVAGSGFHFFPGKITAAPSPKNPRIILPGGSMVGGVPTFQSENPMKQMPSVSLEIETHGATADEAVRQGAQITEKVQTALRKKLGAHGELMVENFSILKTPPTQGQATPSFRQVARERKVYAAHVTVTASTEKLDALGVLIEAGMKAGATQLNSVSFTLNNPATAGKEAIASASKNAQEKAEAVASSMGVKLGRVLSISTNVQVQPQMLYGRALQETMGAAAPAMAERAIMPVMPHELGVIADVNGVYEIQ